MGGHYEFAERAIHHADKTALEGEEDCHLANLFQAEPKAVSALPWTGWSLEAFTANAAPATRLLDEGDSIDLCGQKLTIFHLPGHSPGSIGLLDQKNGIFFSADTIYDGELLDDLPRSDVIAYADTMERLRHLPIATVHGGH